MKNKSYRKMVNNKDLKIKPWGISSKIISHELKVDFILVLTCSLTDTLVEILMLEN